MRRYIDIRIWFLALSSVLLPRTHGFNVPAIASCGSTMSRSPPPPSRGSVSTARGSPLTATNGNANDDGDDPSGDGDDTNGKFLLPPVGGATSSEDFSPATRRVLSTDDTEKEKKVPVAFVGSPKFDLQYTCKKCETRNANKVSRIAYRQGVVIAVCKGCMCKHLIADNLGWSNYVGGFEEGQRNIEEFLASQGRAEDVNRVSPQVFELENLLDATPSSPGVDDVSFE